MWLLENFLVYAWSNVSIWIYFFNLIKSIAIYLIKLKYKSSISNEVQVEVFFKQGNKTSD